MELNEKLMGQLGWLFKAHTQKSRGLLYNTLGKEDSVPYNALIRVKRLVKKGLATYEGTFYGSPLYKITDLGISTYLEQIGNYRKGIHIPRGH